VHIRDRPLDPRPWSARIPTNGNQGQGFKKTESNSEQSPTTEKGDESTGEKSSQLDWWARISNLVMAVGTVALAVIGAIAACIAIRSLNFIRLQTAHARIAAEAARDNAKAALLGAKAIMESDRAWMLMEKISNIYLVPVEIQQGRPSSVLLEFRNAGKTPARMLAWKFGLYISDVSDRPGPSAYDVKGVVFNPIIIPQGADCPQAAMLTSNGGFIRQQELDDILRNRTKMLWLCGIIKYEDIFRPGVEHETILCRHYRVWFAGQEPFFGLAGCPTEYNKET
jgi:hypothetical protein